MMQLVLIVELSVSEVARLAEACAAYRAYAWQELVPTAQRNQTLQAVQGVQGRLCAWQAGEAEPLHLVVSAEEKLAIRQVVSTLMQLAGAEAPSQERQQRLADLAQLRVLVERACRQACRAERREEWQDDLFRIGRH